MSNQDHIYFGSLEQQERQRIIEERSIGQSDTTSLASFTTNATENLMPPPLNRRVQNNQTISSQNQQNQSSHVQSLQLSEESLQAKEKYEQNLKLYQAQKAARSIKLPTNDLEVKMNLRQLEQPICYFGENPSDRRERLRLLCAKYFQQFGKFPEFQKIQTNTSQQNVDDENDHFYYPGPKELKQIREQLASSSFKLAALRIEQQKLKRLIVDPIEEEEVYENACKNASQYDVFMSQFGDTGVITRGSFSSNGQYYATSGGSGEVKVWSVPDCELKTKLVGHLTKTHDVSFHPESLLGLSPNSYANMATCSSDTLIRLWTLNESEELQKSVVLKGHEDRINRLKYHISGKQLLSTSHDNTWRFWDLETRKELICQTGHTKPVYALALHPDGSIVYTGDFASNGALWDLRSGKNIQMLQGHVKNIYAADFSIDGYHLVTGSEDNTIRVWDLRRKQCLQTIPAHYKLISDIKYDQKNSYFFISVSYDNSLKIWNAKDFSLVSKMTPTESKLTSFSISNDLKYLATTCFDRKWMLWQQKF